MKKYSELKERCLAANLEIPKYGLAIYTFGNVSAFDPQNGVFAIKPSGVPYDNLTIGQMVVVNLDGKVVDGTCRPSSDTLTHAVLYRHFTGLGGIVHTHSTYATAWAQAGQAIPIYGTTHADHLPCDVPCTEPMNDCMIKGQYEEETGNQIVNAFAAANLSWHTVEMVLVACHGPFTWGDSPEKAVYNSVVLEELARMACLTRQIAPGTPRLKTTLISKHFERKHGTSAYYGQGPAEPHNAP